MAVFHTLADGFGYVELGLSRGLDVDHFASGRLRPDALATVAALTTLTGRTPILVTGDNPRAAARLSAEAGIALDEVHAGLLPRDKVEAVRRLGARGHKVLVIGDGVNDAPALAAAHTGIAMGRAGSDLALETADAVIVRDELATVPTVVARSRAARRLVVQNLVIAAVFISGLVIWDLAGHLPLPLGVLGHEGSTVLVGLNGLRPLRDAAWNRAAGEDRQAAGASRRVRHELYDSLRRGGSGSSRSRSTSGRPTTPSTAGDLGRCPIQPELRCVRDGPPRGPLRRRDLRTHALAGTLTLPGSRTGAGFAIAA
ncbi:Potassium-transporting ATPase ATP-binding subunit [Streptomyces avidinii]